MLLFLVHLNSIRLKDWTIWKLSSFTMYEILSCVICSFAILYLFYHIREFKIFYIARLECAVLVYLAELNTRQITARHYINLKKILYKLA